MNIDMSVEIGHYALSLAFCVSFVLALLPSLGLVKGSSFCESLSPAKFLIRPLACAMLLLCLLASAMLIKAFLASDFSVLLVWQNSHSQKPYLYKFAAMWGNHEGSMLLWVLVLSAFSCLIAFYQKSPTRLTILTVSLQSGICMLFILFVLIFSNPFARIFPVPTDGEGLNPILQHPALAIHPPLLYLGYVGLSAAFSSTMAGLCLNDLGTDWAQSTRLWTLIAWCGLGSGITLGAFWAYEELGWGGFWFWDPVENASLMPWLLATAGLHALRSFIKTRRLRTWSILLILLAFSASLLGTFLVRSGVLVSVHSFASDHARGLVILLCISLITGSALALFAWRSGGASNNDLNVELLPFASRETAQFINALLLSLCATLVMLATLYPLFFEFFVGRSLAIGPPYYSRVLTPFFLCLLLVLGFLPALGWGGSSFSRINRYVLTFAPLACASGLAVLFFTRANINAALVVALGVWALVGALRTRSPKDAMGTSCAHAGIAIAFIAVGCASLLDVEKFRTMRIGERITLEDRFFSTTLELKEVFTNEGENFFERGARFAFLDDSSYLTPSRRVYSPNGGETTEAAINRTILRDIYVTIATIDGERAKLQSKDFSEDLTADVSTNALSVRVQSKPLMFWLWLGASITVLGGVLSIFSTKLNKGK